MPCILYATAGVLRHGSTKRKRVAPFWTDGTAREDRTRNLLWLDGQIGDFRLIVAGRRVFLYRAAVPASAIDRNNDAGHGHVAEWLRSGLQNRLPRFNSGRGLQKSKT
jgi:hypothetical protein